MIRVFPAQPTISMSNSSEIIKPILVAGLGNILFSDEGIGIRVVRNLQEKSAPRPQVEFFEAGTGGMKLLHTISHREKAVFVDCAKMDSEPGTLCRFSDEEVRSAKKLPGFSLHEADLLEIIGLARKIEACPGKLVIFGIEPFSIEPGEEISPILSRRLDDYEAAVEKELQV